ncbi:MAG: hypothetical protein WCD76_09325 [Pyrinomonadaceae bacterium]
MTDDQTTRAGAISEETRRHVVELRHALLRLHKTLLELERAAYERARGGISNSGEFLQLVMNDPWFAWLRTLSGLVVQIDEALDADEPPTEADAETYIAQTRALLTPNETGAEFGRKYFDALQRSPDVVMEHAKIVKLLEGERK